MSPRATTGPLPVQLQILEPLRNPGWFTAIMGKRAPKALKAQGRTHEVGLEVCLKVWIWGAEG